MNSLATAVRTLWRNPSVRAVTIKGRRYDRATFEDGAALALCALFVAAIRAFA